MTANGPLVQPALEYFWNTCGVPFASPIKNYMKSWLHSRDKMEKQCVVRNNDKEDFIALVFIHIVCAKRKAFNPFYTLCISYILTNYDLW